MSILDDSASGNSVDESNAFPESYLLYLMARVSHLVSASFHAELRALGIDVNTWRILSSLSGCERSVGELADIVLLNQPTLSKMLDRLEHTGLVKRRRDERKRRHVFIRLTDEGTRLAQKLIPLARAHEKEVFSLLNAGERAQFRAMLTRILNSRNV